MSNIQKVVYQQNLITTISYLREALQACPFSNDTVEAYNKIANAKHLLQEELQQIGTGDW